LGKNERDEELKGFFGQKTGLREGRSQFERIERFFLA